MRHHARLNTEVAPQDFTLYAIAAVVLGGTLLAGGRVTIFERVIGAICLGLLPNVMSQLDVPYYYQQPVTGALPIAAVLLPSVARQLRAARQRSRLGAEILRRARGPTPA
jgi:ribose transport system permease protein